MGKNTHAAETDLQIATHCQPPAPPITTFTQTAQRSLIFT